MGEDPLGDDSDRDRMPVSEGFASDSWMADALLMTRIGLMSETVAV